MTEEELKTLCKSLEERYGENSTVTLKQSDFNKMWASIDRYAKENKCLQEQLNEANEVIKGYAECYKKYPDGTIFSFEVRKHPAHSYLEKWGIKQLDI